MAILIISPDKSAPAYTLAAKAFQAMYQKITGIKLPISSADDGTSDLVVIGSDSVNDYLMQQVVLLNLNELPIRYGTDDYCILSHKDGVRKVLILAGGRGRSTIYAVYDYFERYAGCHYFWDGDVIPKSNSLPMDGIHVAEAPRFEYRGTRYFAHRGLKRFQAEHWNFEDWKRELDWLVKKRLNFFMLRIGMDDIWQKAFPDDVPYPEGFQTIDARGFHDRSDFWTLEYRGNLRKKVMQYARDLDLTFPVDCGTMTHWYSRTPQAFLDAKKPTFVTQEVAYYADGNTGNVLDFTKKEMMSYYTKLTETMVSEYDRDTSLFHTIGLGERSMYKDSRKNFALKKIAYRRVAEEIRTRYPNSKLLLASWDFAGWWNASEVEKLTQEMDPERTILLDYTSEVVDPKSSFLNWGVIGKFPYIFGIFHAFESESEIRGPYDRIEERFSIAANDPYCKGLIYWPELSHNDPLVLEYLTENAWQPNSISVEKVIRSLCQKRYGEHCSAMESSWLEALPVIKLGDWGSRTQRSPEDPNYEDYAKLAYSHNDIWTRLTLFLSRPDSDDPIVRKFFAKRIEKYRNVTGIAARAIKQLPANINDSSDAFVFRDVIDLIRTMLGRYMNLIVMVALEYTDDPNKIGILKHHYAELMDIMINVLASNSDFSMLSTLNALKETAPVNPVFEPTLKRNLCNGYCLQAAYEPAVEIYKKEIDIGFDWLASSIKSKEQLSEINQQLIDAFIEKPLSEIQPGKLPTLSSLIQAAANAIEKTEATLFA